VHIDAGAGAFNSMNPTGSGVSVRAAKSGRLRSSRSGVSDEVARHAGKGAYLFDKIHRRGA
jgi:hypothetical protein